VHARTNSTHNGYTALTYTATSLTRHTATVVTPTVSSITDLQYEYKLNKTYYYCYPRQSLSNGQILCEQDGVQTHNRLVKYRFYMMDSDNTTCIRALDNPLLSSTLILNTDYVISDCPGWCQENTHMITYLETPIYFNQALTVDPDNPKFIIIEKFGPYVYWNLTDGNTVNIAVELTLSTSNSAYIKDNYDVESLAESSTDKTEIIFNIETLKSIPSEYHQNITINAKITYYCRDL